MLIIFLSFVLVIYMFIVLICNSFDRVCVLLFWCSFCVDVFDWMLMFNICWWISLVFTLDLVNEFNWIFLSLFFFIFFSCVLLILILRFRREFNCKGFICSVFWMNFFVVNWIVKYCKVLLRILFFDGNCRW